MGIIVTVNFHQASPSSQEASTRKRKHTQPHEDPVVSAFKSTVRISQRKRADQHKSESASYDWATCKKFALEHLQSTTSYRLANVLKSCKDESFIDEELFGKLIEHVAQDEGIMNSFIPVGVSMTVQCLGMLARKTKKKGASESEFFATTVRDFVGELLESSRNRGLFVDKDFGARELSSTMHGIGLMFSNQGLHKGYDILGVANAILEEFVKKGQGGGAMPQSLSNILIGCAYVQYENLDLISRVCQMISLKLRRGEKIGEQALANIVWSLGRLGFYDEDLFGEIELVVSQDLLERMNNQELANLVEGLGLLESKSGRVMKLLGNEVLKRDRLEGFKQQELANVMYGFGLAGFRDEDVVSQIIQQITKKKRLQAFKAQSLARILQGMASLDYHDREVLTLLGQEACHLDRLEKYSLEEISDIVTALQKLKFWVDPVMAPLHEEFNMRESTFSPRLWRE